MIENRKTRKLNLSDHYDNTAYDYHKELYLSERKYSPLRYRQHYIEKMIEKLKLSEGAKILDVGCGPGELIANLLNRGYDLWGIDISRKMIEKATHTVSEKTLSGWNQGFVGDVEKLTFTDNFFDVVVAAGVIEYQNDDQKSLAEINRVLKINGSVIINVTNKYSYVKSLEKIYMYTKENASLKRFKNFIRNRLLDKKNISKPFSHPKRRVHSPKMFDRQLCKFGFEKVGYNYFHFGLLPQPLSSIFRVINEPVAIRMEALSGSPFGVVGGGYIVIGKKVANIEDGCEDQEVKG